MLQRESMGKKLHMHSEKAHLPLVILTLQSNVNKKGVEDNSNFCGLLRISEL